MRIHITLKFEHHNMSEIIILYTYLFNIILYNSII